MIKTDVLIIGGGIAGLSTAYFLGQSGKKTVIVLEQEKKLGGHASGRNAGMLRQALPDPVLAEMARDSRRYFEKLKGNGWKKVSLWKNGSLILSGNSKRSELESIARSLKEAKVPSEWLSKEQASKKVPVLRDADFSAALFCASDAMVELEPLLNGFTASLKKMKIPVLRGMRFGSIESVNDGYRVRAGKKVFLAKQIVNAAGAWASWVAEKAGASKIPLEAYRRHLFVSPGSGLRAPGFQKWPFVWDIGLDFYFRPTPEGLLLSPCDKTLETKGDRRESVNPAARRLLMEKMRRFSSGVFGGHKVSRAVSGLRTMTPDGRFVVGEDPKKKGFYWVAGLGGHGVTTCFSVGRMAANAVLGQNKGGRLEKALAPGRFL